MMDHPNICNLDQSRKTGTNFSSSIGTRDEGTIPNHLKPTPAVDDLNLDCALQKAGWICYDLRK